MGIKALVGGRGLGRVGTHYAPLEPAVQRERCGFCGRCEVLLDERGGLMQHLELGGFTLCPASGRSVARSALLALKLTTDFRLAHEDALDKGCYAQEGGAA